MSPFSSAFISSGAGYSGWHATPEEFHRAAARAYTNTTIACVYNRADAVTMRSLEEAEVIDGCRAIGIGLDIPGPSDFGIVEGILCDRAFLDDRQASALELTTVEELATAGITGAESATRVLAAAALARSYGVAVAAIHDSLVPGADTPLS